MSTFWLMNMPFVMELSVRRVCLTSERLPRVVICVMQAYMNRNVRIYSRYVGIMISLVLKLYSELKISKIKHHICKIPIKS